MKFLVITCFIFFILGDQTNGQLCNGSLSDPIINITFGTSHGALPKGFTSFEYTGGCPGKGKYTIQNLIFGCGETPSAHSWYMLAGDHTRDLNGQYMLVNAESTPGIIYQDTVNGLCGNTRYQFAAWAANVMQDFACGGNPVLPDLTLKVSTLSGQVLDSINTGKLPIESSRIWKQFGLTLNMPSGISDVILTLSTNPISGCGSAFVVDDITFNMCGPRLTVLLDGQVQDGNVCADYSNPFLLSAVYDAGFADPVFQWQQSLDTGATWTDIVSETNLSYQIPRRTTGSISYRLTMSERQNMLSPSCRVVSNAIYTEIHPVPGHQPPKSILGCIDKDLQLPKPDPSSLSVEWSGPNGYYSASPASVVPGISYADTGVYTLKQNFYFGCTSVDTFNLDVFPSTTISVQPSYTICEGTSNNISASGRGTFEWSPSDFLSNDGIPNPIITPLDSIIYKVTVTNSFGCKDSAYVTVNVLRNPNVSAGADQQILLGDTTLLQGTVTGTATTHAWTPDLFMNDNGSLHPAIFPPADMQYTLTATSNVGCGNAFSSVNIKVFKEIYVPNAFTPNGDGINDFFRIIAPTNYMVKSFAIFNRWGEKVFSSNSSLSQGWNGNLGGLPQPASVYVYYLEMKSPRGKWYIKKGSFSLLR